MNELSFSEIEQIGGGRCAGDWALMAICGVAGGIAGGPLGALEGVALGHKLHEIIHG